MPCIFAADPTFSCVLGYAIDLAIMAACCLAFGIGAAGAWWFFKEKQK
jgi:hypothetical protein